jgi:hypothetical protein
VFVPLLVELLDGARERSRVGGGASPVESAGIGPVVGLPGLLERWENLSRRVPAVSLSGRCAIADYGTCW